MPFGADSGRKTETTKSLTVACKFVTCRVPVHTDLEHGRSRLGYSQPTGTRQAVFPCNIAQFSAVGVTQSLTVKEENCWPTSGACTAALALITNTNRACLAQERSLPDKDLQPFLSQCVSLSVALLYVHCTMSWGQTKPVPPC